METVINFLDGNGHQLLAYMIHLINASIKATMTRVLKVASLHCNLIESRLVNVTLIYMPVLFSCQYVS